MAKLEKPRITVGRGPTRVCKVLCLVLLLAAAVVTMLVRDTEVVEVVKVAEAVHETPLAAAPLLLPKNASDQHATQAVASNPLSDISPP